MSQQLGKLDSTLIKEKALKQTFVNAKIQDLKINLLFKYKDRNTKREMKHTYQGFFDLTLEGCLPDAVLEVYIFLKQIKLFILKFQKK